MRYNYYFVFVISQIIDSVYGINYVLLPKNDFSSLNYEYFNKEHNIDLLASIGDLQVYKTTADNYQVYSSTLNDLFYVEIDQKYSVVPMDVKLDNVVWVAGEGETQFVMSSKNDEFPWHLDRISKRDLPLNGSYPYDKKGSCHSNNNVTIHTYVVDTGVDVTHSEFEENIEFLENFTGDDISTDCNSHGTFCSSIIGGSRFGVCKDAKLFGVKVLDCEGSGTTSGVIGGMNYVYNKHLQLSKDDPSLRSIMSMSLGGGYSAIMNRVVEKMVRDSNTFYVVVAAGNENNDACKTSPASARGIFSVMASDRHDKRAYFSNWGMCAQIYAPGVNVNGAVLDNRTAVLSGTSFSAPNVAGVMNHYLDMYPELNMEGLLRLMLNDSSNGKIKGNKKNTDNLLVYVHREHHE